MKLVTFAKGQTAKIGVIINDTTIAPLCHLAPDMIALIANWDIARPKVEAVATTPEDTVEIASVRLLAPVPRPGKIFAIGLNYADHVAETGMATPASQIWFTKAGTSVNGPYDPVQIPRGSMMTDYEVEMVAVIGKGGRHISKEDAAAHVFGYCVGNDITERAWQMRSPQFCLGKSFDTHAPFGPWITTSDAASDVHDLGIRCFVNGDERQSSNTRHLIFNLWEQIAELSQAMTLEPGDVIFSGTPGGVGMAMKPMTMLKAGDVVRCEVDGLGHIEAIFVAE